MDYNKLKLNEDTYNEAFIFMNAEKILQKIRMLMRESFFYKKNTLIQFIQKPKEYPLSQIYAALTQLIDDNNEYIVDKYGRTGHLINIGDYYLFQPVELTDRNISIFERSVPVDYKHDKIRFELDKAIPMHIQKDIVIDETIPEQEQLDIKYAKGKAIIKELQENYNLALEFTKGAIVPRGDDTWYKHCGAAMIKLSKDYVDIKPYLLDFLIAHMIEMLLFDEKIELIRYLYVLKDEALANPMENKIKEYFEGNLIITKELTAILFYEVNNKKIMILNDKQLWVDAEPEDIRDIENTDKIKQLLNLTKKDFSAMVGYIGYEKNNKYMVFKTKNMEKMCYDKK